VTEVPLPLELPEPELSPACWYCGAADRPFEHEHQLPVSRGGRHGANVVRACAPCNDLKGPLQLNEFRQGVAERLGVEVHSVVFAGEATPERPATPTVQAIRSLEADRSVVRLAPEAKAELEQALRFLRGVISPTLTQRDLATAAVAEHLDGLRARYVGGAQTTWPHPSPSLFDDEDPEASPVLTGRRELGQTPKVTQHREKTSVAGDLLDWARAGVEYRRSHGEPELQLVEWINAAVRAALEADSARFAGFPTLDEARHQRYGGGETVGSCERD
jgi:hypothetical protein